jgi:hypothetical protein
MSIGGNVTQSDAPWSPDIGDVARVKDTDRLGTVVRLKGVRERRFRLAMLPVPGAAKSRTGDRWYGLDELEPSSE